MKTIKETATENAKHYLELIYPTKWKFEKERKIAEIANESGFEKGVKFAQRWISVKDELPKIDDEVILKFEDGSKYIFVYNTTLKQCGNNITHWRPIELE